MVQVCGYAAQSVKSPLTSHLRDVSLETTTLLLIFITVAFAILISTR
jgi:hypothetical protein